MDNKQKKKDHPTRKNFVENIMKSLGKDGGNSKTVLVGEAGIGKTWLAKEFSKCVTQESYNVLWLHLNRRIEDKKTLYEYLATQLSLISEFEEGEAQNELGSLESLEKMITEALSENNKNNLLLILDDAGSMTTENYAVMKDLEDKRDLEDYVMEDLESKRVDLEDYVMKDLEDKRDLEDYVMEDLELRKFLKQHPTTLKTLVTRREEKKPSTTIKDNDKSFYQKKTTIKVTPLTEDESRGLFNDSHQKLLESSTIEDWPVLLERLYDNGEIKDRTLMSCILRKSKGLPAAIVVLTKSLHSI